MSAGLVEILSSLAMDSELGRKLSMLTREPHVDGGAPAVLELRL